MRQTIGLALVGALTALSLSNTPASAQWWPWADNGPPMQRQPSPPRGPQGGPPPPPQQQAPVPAPSPSFNTSNRPPICLQLEQRLAVEANRGNQSQDQLPKIEGEIRQADRVRQQAEVQLERNDCFDYFLFAKSLKRNKVCIDLSQQAEGARRRVAELEAQRQQIQQTGGRSLREDIVAELARNHCGPGYQQASRSHSPFSGLWQDEEGGGSGGKSFGNLPFATYRTVCVRLCDGYYFPVSFSTLPAQFEHDADVCQQRCAAPAELYYHRNPGDAVEQAISHKTKQGYTALRTAFRYRKEYIAGCSCKQAEYVPPAGPAVAADRRADAVNAASGLVPGAPATPPAPKR